MDQPVSITLDIWDACSVVSELKKQAQIAEVESRRRYSGAVREGFHKQAQTLRRIATDIDAQLAAAFPVASRKA